MFEHPERSGEAANSRFYFSDRHLVAAYVYARLAGKGYFYGFAGLPSIHLRIELPPEILLFSDDHSAATRISWPAPVYEERVGS